MKKTSKKYVELVDRDLALACVVDPREDAEVEFFLQGLRQATEQADRAAARAARVAIGSR